MSEFTVYEIVTTIRKTSSKVGKRSVGVKTLKVLFKGDISE